MRNILVVASLLGFALLQTTSAYAMECGDHDGNGSVGAADALIVLRKSVGLTADLQCPAALCDSTTTTLTTPSSTCCEDECLYDDDCPGFPQFLCGGPDNHSCVDCDADDADCDQGEVCVDYECVPAEQ